MKTKRRICATLAIVMAISLLPTFGLALLDETEPATEPADAPAIQDIATATEPIETPAIQDFAPAMEEFAAAGASDVPGEQSFGLSSLAGLIPGSVNLASKPNYNENPYGLIINTATAANGNAQRIIDGIEYEQNNTGASSHVVAMHNAATGTAANPTYVTISWPEPYVFTGTSVMWWISGQSALSVWPQEVTVEYSTGELLPFPAQPASANAALATRHAGLVWHKVDGVSGTVSVETNGSAPGSVNANWRRNTIWNNYIFAEPVVARHIRLSIVSSKTAGANANPGINMWEVYGYSDPEATELELISENYFKNLVVDVGLPAFGAAGSPLTWKIVEGDAEALNAATGAIKRPAYGAPAVTGKIEATAVGATTRTRVFDFSVMPLPNKTPQQIVDDAIAALNIGQLAGRTESFTFPANSADGAIYVWETNSAHVWPDGTVLRPPLGMGDATGITVKATARFGDAQSDPKTWTGISVPEYIDDARKIVSAENPTIYSPVGSAPKLPNYLRVTYSDDTTEMRRIQWSGFSTAAQGEQAARPLGDRYTHTGNVLGDGTGNGFQVSANIVVVEADHPEYGFQVVPSNHPVATALPMAAVTIDTDPNGDANVLTQNRAGYVTYIAGQNPTQYLHQFRTAYGLSTTGYTSPSGWTGKLRGAGAGHYLTALALAFNSQPTTTQKNTLVSRMDRMTREMREMQQMTMNVPHPTENRNWEARDFLGAVNLDGTSTGMTGDQRVMGMTLLLNDWLAYASSADPNQGYKTYGYGYLNAIPPHHLVGNENYAVYSDGGNGVWAPYYGLHKILAGLVEIYYALNGDATVYTFNDTYNTGSATGQQIADRALAMASDMGLWISNRFAYRTRAGVRPAAGEPGHELPGWRDSNWAGFISGEFGGMNEALARIYEITGNPGHLSAAEGFWNDGGSGFTEFRPFMGDLAVNRDSIRILHSNQAIPAIVGVLWTFRGNNDPKYYNVAENFWEYNIGRYAWTTGNVKGNPSNVEQYVGAYNQGAALMLHNNANETCAAYNLMKLSKFLNEHNPDDAKYMDHVERVFIGQIIGSTVTGSSTSQGCYHYPIHINSSRSRGAASSTNADCCSGTRAEIHVKYQDSMYYATDDAKTFYVGLYMPATAKWAAQDITIKQETVWPSEKSTFRFTPGAGTGEFEMKFRVPYWATKDFSITLNGVPINGGVFEPSTYVSTGVRAWSATDVIVVDMPYEFWIDYLPGKPDGKWMGSIMYGPVLMAADGTATATRITAYEQADLYIDSYMNIDNMGVTITGRQTLASLGGSSVGNIRNVPTLTAVIGGVARPIRPHYFVSGNVTTYFYINTAGGSWLPQKATLFGGLMLGRELLSSGDYTSASSRFLISAVANGAGAYSNESASQQNVETAIGAINDAIALLEAIDESVTEAHIASLSALVAAAKAIKGDDYTWDSFAGLQGAVASAEALIAASAAAKVGEFIQAEQAIKAATDSLVLLTALDRSELTAALAEAAMKENPANAGEKLFPEHEFMVYSRLSWNNFLGAVAEAEGVLGNVSKNYNQSEVDEAAAMLSAATTRLQGWELADERGALEAVIAAAKALDPAAYTPERWETIQGYVETPRKGSYTPA